MSTFWPRYGEGHKSIRIEHKRNNPAYNNSTAGFCRQYAHHRMNQAVCCEDSCLAWECSMDNEPDH